MGVRVIVADDETIVRSAIAMVLDCEPDLDVVAQAGDGQQAVEAARRLRPDVVVMDVRMPGMDGVEATRAIAADAGAPAVLMLTTFSADEAVHAALRAGAAGYLLKHAALDDLPRAVRAVACGEGWVDPGVARLVIGAAAGAPDQAPAVCEPADSAFDVLTSREREVLALLARGLSNSEIARELFVGAGTVKTHVSHVLTKLGVRDRTQAVALAFERGLRTGSARAG